MEVTVTRKAHGAAAPGIGGVGGYVLQEDVTVITTHTGAQIIIEGTTARLITSHGSENVTADTPAEARGDHAALVAHWQDEAGRWAASVALPTSSAVQDSIEVEGVAIIAPGFTPETFTAALERAREGGYFSIRPGRSGAVRIDTGRSGEVYTTTRQACSCKAGQHGQPCKHRAAAIWINDVAGINLCHTEVLGFDTTGQPVAAYGLEVAS